MPNLVNALSKIVVAQDNKGLMDGILEPIKRNSIPHVGHYLTNHGSLQRSLTQEMGGQLFDERVLSAFERTEKDMNINTIEVFYSIDSDLKAEVALYSDVSTHDSLSVWKYGLTMVIVTAVLAFIHAKVTAKGKNSSSGDMKYALIHE
jgi:4-hydroxy-3-methylbut-2-en-1-yl diphosphate synthase IspG/GcpE